MRRSTVGPHSKDKVGLSVSSSMNKSVMLSKVHEEAYSPLKTNGSKDSLDRNNDSTTNNKETMNWW